MVGVRGTTLACSVIPIAGSLDHALTRDDMFLRSALLCGDSLSLGDAPLPDGGDTTGDHAPIPRDGFSEASVRTCRVL